MKTGLFHLCLEIGTEAMGAQHMFISVGAFTPEKTITGIGHLTQAVNPPLDMSVNISGTYTYMCVMPKNCHIQLLLTGTPIVKTPPYGGIGPVLEPVISMVIVLTEDWKSGGANIKYLNEAGQWVELTNVPVKQVPCETIS